MLLGSARKVRLVARARSGRVGPVIVLCAQCQTRYVLEDALVPPLGVSVQCSRCQHVFFVAPEEKHLDPEVYRVATEPRMFGTVQQPPPQPTGKRMIFGFPPVPAPSAAPVEPAPVPPESELDAMLRRLAAAPDDLDARIVAADWLLERGDPRGRLMSLQLEEERLPPDLNRKVKINVLVRDHGAHWSPPGTRAPAFRRGLLHHVEWVSSTDPQHPGWASVESIRCTRPNVPRAGGSAFTATPLLKRVTDLSREMLMHLLATRPGRLEELGIALMPADFLGLSRVLAPVPNLRALTLRATTNHIDRRVTPEHLESVLAQFPALERLTISLPSGRLDALWRIRNTRAPKLRLEFLVPWDTGFDRLELLRLDPAAGTVAGPWQGNPGGLVLDFIQMLAEELGQPLRFVSAGAGTG